MTTEPLTTEAEAVAKIVRAGDATTEVYVAPETVPVWLLTPDDYRWEKLDPQPMQPSPRRSTGNVLVHDADSFIATVKRRQLGDELAVYADYDRSALVAVLNDDDGQSPGWRDYQVTLDLRATTEWKGWIDGQGLGTQKRFAERIEDGEAEIVDPSAAHMLELAQTFHATTEVKFRGGVRLQSGDRQFRWDESTEASGGIEPGTVAVPETFRLAVRPFARSDRYEVVARFRFSLRSGALTVGYQLVRPEDVLRVAFSTVVDQVMADAGDWLFVAGPAPAPRT